MRKTDPEVSSAWAECADTQEKLEIHYKEGSQCYFFKPFVIGNEEIQLRLDFGDIVQGNPMLDADFKDVITKKHQKLSGRRRQAHHTNVLDGENRIYCWEFENVKRAIRVYVSWNISAQAYSGEAVTFELATNSGNEK